MSSDFSTFLQVQPSLIYPLITAESLKKFTVLKTSANRILTAWFKNRTRIPGPRTTGP